jgi:hypothetical protein
MRPPPPRFLSLISVASFILLSCSTDHTPSPAAVRGTADAVLRGVR